MVLNSNFNFNIRQHRPVTCHWL